MAQPVARAGTAKATTRARERTRANSFFILSNFLSKNCFCFVPGISPGLALRPIWDFPVCTSRCYHIITPLSTPLLRFCNKLFWGVIFQPLSNNGLPQKIRLQRISSSPATQGHSGWNKVALLTAVRNSPCSCPFSVSLHPPPAALNSEPQRGSLLVGRK